MCRDRDFGRGDKTVIPKTLPLSGAILIANPRKENMALALTNPNDRRRINRLARAKVRTGRSAADLVAAWEAQKHLPAKKRDAILQRTPNAKAMVAHLASGKAKPTSDAHRKALAKAKREIAAEFGKLDGYKVWKKGKKRIGYSTRAVGSKADRYLLNANKASEKRKVFGKTRTVRTANNERIRSQNANRVGIRAAASDHRTHRGAHWKAALAAGPKRSASSAPKRGGPKKGVMPEGLRRYHEARKAAKAAARSNPYGYGDDFGALALENPFPFVGSLLPSSVTVPTVVGFGGAAAVHLFAVPKAQEMYAKIPVVGDYINEWVPYTTTGVIGGAAAAFAASKVRGDASKYLTALASGLVLFGIGLDVKNAIASRVSTSDSLGDLALDFGGLGIDLGALALENPGYGDGMAWETASLSASPESLDYSQASLADAGLSGADFSADEGQNLLNGTFGSAYGLPPRRQAGHVRGASHLAGRPGHRWGWLVQLVGMNKARQIAALPPNQRVALIARLRAAAIRTFQQQTASQTAESAATVASLAPQFDAPAAGTAPDAAGGAQGPMGPGEDLSGALFMGA